MFIMEGNEVDNLDMVAYRRASGERKVLIERKSASHDFSLGWKGVC